MFKKNHADDAMNFGYARSYPRVTLPLILAKAGEKVKIASIAGGHQVQSRLADLGLLPNTEVQVLNRSRSGPLLVMVKGSRLALGRGLGRKIMVEEETR